MFKFVLLLAACVAATSAGLVGPSVYGAAYPAAPLAYSAGLAAAPLAYHHAAPLAYSAHPAPLAYSSYAAPAVYKAPLAYAAAPAVGVATYGSPILKTHYYK